MSYYQGDHNQGDYYEGDYYQGDPFLGALIGTVGSWLGRKLLKRGAKKALVASTGAGALIGAGGGMVTGAVGGALVQQGAGALWRKFVSPPTPFGVGGMTQTGRSSFTGQITGQTGGACACPTGYHPNKTVTRMGHPPGTTCIRNRSMNVANPRALRRSLRRVAGFGKLAARARKTVNATARAMK